MKGLFIEVWLGLGELIWDGEVFEFSNKGKILLFLDLWDMGRKCCCKILVRVRIMKKGVVLWCVGKYLIINFGKKK